MPVDYSKFDKIQDSDEEESYDDYLRERYGISSGWQPGCGMQPPVLGGRTPGKTYEDHELDWNELDFKAEGDGEPEAEAGVEQRAETSAPSATTTAGRCWRYFLGLLRIIEMVAWLLPTIACVHVSFFSGEDVKIELAVYPITIVLTFIMGLFDVVMAATGACHAEGRGSLAFACWFKRVFLSMTFLSYEAQFTSTGSLLLGRLTSRLLCGLIMISIWTARKVYGYARDLRIVMKDTSSSSSVTMQVPGGRILLLVEALAEILFACVHLALLPEGLNFMGIRDQRPLQAAMGVVLFFSNGLVFTRSRSAACDSVAAQRKASKVD